MNFLGSIVSAGIFLTLRQETRHFQERNYMNPHIGSNPRQYWPRRQCFDLEEHFDHGNWELKTEFGKMYIRTLWGSLLRILKFVVKTWVRCLGNSPVPQQVFFSDLSRQCWIFFLSLLSQLFTPWTGNSRTKLYGRGLSCCCSFRFNAQYQPWDFYFEVRRHRISAWNQSMHVFTISTPEVGTAVLYFTTQWSVSNSCWRNHRLWLLMVVVL